VDVTDEVGLDFTHEAGVDPHHPTYYMPESMSGGAALFDADQDGDLDIYLINGALSNGDSAGGAQPCNQYYRNDGGRFINMTDASGLGDTGYGMGVAVGDIDNDGDEDVFVTNVGVDRLYRNNGDGTFDEVTSEAGIVGEVWSASSAFLDYDADGALDLFVTHYLALDPSVKAYDGAGRPEYPGPQLFRPLDDTLYRNNGDGTFEDVTDDAGISGAPGRGLGVACADFNDDGRMDFYVANDRDPNRLWINRGDGTFEDQAPRAGVDVNAFGQPEASMGVALGDVYGDGDLDLFLTHLFLESNTLYQNIGQGLFEDRSIQQGLGAASREFTGFGTVMLDCDHDGDLDIAVANGRVMRSQPYKNDALSSHWIAYAEPNLFFENDGAGRFVRVESGFGAFTSVPDVGRGLVAGDLDNDGDLDMLLTNGGGRARLYRNDASKKGGWLIVEARDAGRHRFAEGATVTVVIGEKRIRRDVNRGFSYLCSGDPRLHFGLGAAKRYDRIEVQWPDGGRETFPGGGANGRVLIVRGEGVR
jgi:hypothetical protein